jgi:hypothetical protein
MRIEIIKERIEKEDLKKLTREGFGVLVKVAVDVKKEILAMGGEWHSEGQDLLVVQEHSQGQDVWGINFHPFEKGERRIEYIALINIKPALGNRKMEIEDSGIRKKIKEIVEKLILPENETITA